MAYRVEVGALRFRNAHDYTVTEDSTPIDPSDNSGGTGQFTVSVPEPDEAQQMYGSVATLVDDNQGTVTGSVIGLNSSDGLLTLTAGSRLDLLNADRYIPPFTGTLGDWFEVMLALVGVVTEFIIDDTISGRTIVYRGMDGNVWDSVKLVCIAQAIEIALVSNIIVVRPVRLRDAVTRRDIAQGWSLAGAELARTVEIAWYDNAWRTDSLAYPVGGWNEDVPVFSVNAGETRTETVDLGGTMLTIQQPTCVDWVDRDYADTSVYAVVGTGEGSDLPITPAQWAAGGGSLTVAIDEDGATATLTIVGSSETQYAPYSIAMTAGPSDRYSSLRLVGTGTFFAEHLLTRHCAVDPSAVTRELGTTIRNSAITTRAQATSLATWAVRRYSSPHATLSITTSGVNRVGISGVYSYVTLDELDALNAAATLDALDAMHVGMSINDIDAQTAALTADSFANQAFGNIGGARLKRNNAMYRIRSTSPIGPGSLSYSAEDDTTLDDVDSMWVGATLDDLSAEFATLDVQALAPMRRTYA